MPLKSTLIQKQGFALIISMVLMGFVLMLILLLSIYTARESTTASVKSRQNIAEQNALLGLSIAIGKLQEYAGQDQRVTARADILDNDIFAPHLPAANTSNWVGVWNTENFDATSPSKREFLTWLVSMPGGSEAEAHEISSAEAFQVSDDTVELVGEGSVTQAEDHVSVGKVPANGGQYAFWLSDENTKANVAPSTEWLKHGSSEENQSIANRVPTRSGISNVESLTSLQALDSPDYNIEELLKNTITLSQVASLQNFQQAGITSEAVEGSFQSITTNSFGLLTNTASGGLKKNLFSYLDEETSATLNDNDEIFALNDGAGPNYGQIKSWYTSKDNLDAEGALTVTAPTATSPAVTPVIVQVLWQVYGCYDGTWGAGATVAFRVLPRVFLWNPYSVDLKIPEGMTVDLEFGNAKELRFFTYYDDDNDNRERGVADYADFKLLRYAISPITIPAGKILDFTLEASSGANGFAVDYNGGDWTDENIDGHAPGGTLQAHQFNDAFHSLLRTNIAVPSQDRDLIDDNITVKVIQNSGDKDVIVLRLNDEALYTLQTADLQIDKNAAKETPLREVGSGAGAIPTQKHGKINAYRGLTTNENAHDRVVRLYTNFNPRASIIDDPYFGKDIDSRKSDITWTNPVTTDSVFSEPYGDLGDPVISRAMAITRGDAGQGDTFILFDIPSENYSLISLGQFQHVNFNQLAWEPPYPFGNSLASPQVNRENTKGSFDPDYQSDYEFKDISYLLNEALWDDYFLGEFTIQDINGVDTIVARNPRMIALTDELADLKDYEESAQHLFVDGAFNVNSTDADAWAAMLSSFNNVAPYGKTAIPTESPNSFPRSFSPNKDAFDTETEITLSPNAIAGYRPLTNDEIKELASKIADEVKTRGPFMSLSHFVNRSLVPDTSDHAEAGLMGVLQAAITKSGINDIYQDEPAKSFKNDWLVKASEHGRYLPEHVSGYIVDENDNIVMEGARGDGLPGYLTQADLLERIGSVLTVRGDTFLIRAYGSADNPLTGQPEAEAYLEAIVQRTPEDADSMGRPFRLVSFRWLNKNDI